MFTAWAQAFISTQACSLLNIKFVGERSRMDFRYLCQCKLVSTTINDAHVSVLTMPCSYRVRKLDVSFALNLSNHNAQFRRLAATPGGDVAIKLGGFAQRMESSVNSDQSAMGVVYN